MRQRTLWGVEGLSDREVLARVIAGEPVEFGVLWDRHCDRILNHLLRVGEQRADAEDLTAVVFLELWRHRDRVRYVDDAVLPWLIVTAQNVHRNAARSRRRYRAMLASLPPASAVSDPADALDGDDRTDLVRRVLAEARGTDQDLAILTAVEGYTVGQAAQAVGLTESAARMRLSRLRATIRSAASTAASLEGGAT